MTESVDSPSSAPDGLHITSPTPYLDCELRLPHLSPYYRQIPAWQTVLILGLFALRTPFEIYILILSVTLIHEAGHCLVGLIAGLELDRIRVGPVELDSYRRLHWEWRRSSLLGGHALMLPKANSALPVRLAAYIAGGPAANIVCGLVVLELIPMRNAHLTGLAQLFVAGSFVAGFANLIPFRRYGFSSDGMKLVMLLLNKGQQWIFLLGRHAAIKGGETVQAAEIDPKFLLENEGSHDHVGANWVAYTVADRKGNYNQAARHLEACLAKSAIVPPEFREELILAAARFQATRRRRNDLARQWLDSSDGERSKINRAHTEALVLFSEGKIDEALAKADEEDRFVAQLPSGPWKTLHLQASRQLREIIEKGPVVPTSPAETL